jgi:hypothetical protein
MILSSVADFLLARLTMIYFGGRKWYSRHYTSQLSFLIDVV